MPQIGGADGTGDWGACDAKEPRNRRTRSSIVIEAPGGRLLVDASPDLRAQLLACGVPGVDGVVFTHSHADHVLGIDDIRILNRIAGRALDSFASQHTMAELSRRFEYAFKPWSGSFFFRPALIPHVMELGQAIEFEGLSVMTFRQDHGTMESMGLRVGGFGYSTDVVTLDERALALLAGVDTWLVDCFQRRAHTTHANVAQVVAWAERLQPRRVVLTHMGHDMDWDWMQSNLPSGIEPAYDGMVLDVADEEGVGG